MYGRKLRIPLDILYGYTGSNEPRYDNIEEMRENLSEIYKVVRENMHVRQDTAATYHDKNRVEDVLEVGNDVYVYYPKGNKFELRWNGPFEILKCRHPSYLVAVKERGSFVDKWFTRDKLRIKENKENARYERPVILGNATNHDSDSDSCDEQYDRSSSTPYNLRGNVRNPDRYGSYITHFAEVCGYEVRAK